MFHSMYMSKPASSYVPPVPVVPHSPVENLHAFVASLPAAVLAVANYYGG
jgi:hypothetical protein